MIRESLVTHDVDLSPVPVHSYWRHNENGNIYRILLLTNLDATNPKFVPTVVFQGRDGRHWSRPFAEWSKAFTRIYPAKIIKKNFLN